MFDPDDIMNNPNENPDPNEIEAKEPETPIAKGDETEPASDPVTEPVSDPAPDPVEDPAGEALAPVDPPEEPNGEAAPQGPEPGTFAWFQVEKYKKSVANREAMANALSGRSLKIYAILESVKQGWVLLLSLVSLLALPLILVAMATGNLENADIQFNSGMDLFAIVDLILVWVLVAHLGKNGGKNLAADIKGLRIMRVIRLVSGAIGTILVVLLSGFVTLMILFAAIPMDEIVWDLGPQYGDLVAGIIGILPIILLVASISMILDWVYQFCLYRYLGDSMKFLEGEAVAPRTGYLRFWQIMRIVGQVAGVLLAFVMAGVLLALPNLFGAGSYAWSGMGTTLILVLPVLLSVFGSAMEIALCVLRLRLFARAEKVIKAN